MSDKLRLFNTEINDSLYDKDGRVKDPEIAHEMAKIEDPYHKRDAFGLIKPRPYRIKRGENLAEVAGEELLRQKQELKREKQEQEYEENLSKHSQPKEPKVLEIGHGKEFDDPKLIAKHAVDLLLQEWPDGFPLNKEVELVECSGNLLSSNIFDISNQNLPYETFYKETVDSLVKTLQEQGFRGRAAVKRDVRLVGLPNKQKIEGVQENIELYVRTCLYYDETGVGVQPKIKINVTRLPAKITTLVKTR